MGLAFAVLAEFPRVRRNTTLEERKPVTWAIMNPNQYRSSVTIVIDINLRPGDRVIDRDNNGFKFPYVR